MSESTKILLFGVGVYLAWCGCCALAYWAAFREDRP